MLMFQRRFSTQNTLARLGSLALVGILAGVAPGIGRAEISVEVNGVDAEIRANVFVFLSLERFRKQTGLDSEMVARLQERVPGEVRAALRPFGYYDPVIESSLTPTGTEGNYKARIDIEPGPAVFMENVDVQVTGAGAAAFQRILQRPALRVGERLSHAKYDTMKSDLQRTAATLGFLDARLTQSELRVDPQQHKARVTLALETGPRYHFGATTIEQTVVNESLIRKYVRYRQDEPFDATELLRTQFALDDSQYFSSVEVIPGEPDRTEHVVPIQIHAAANRRHRYSYGVGYGTDTQVRGTASWENRAVNHAGHRFRVDIKAASQAQSLETRYLIPFGDPALEKFSLELSTRAADVGDLKTTSTEFQPSITQIRGGWQRVLFGIVTRTTTRTAASSTPRKTDTLFIPGISYASVPEGYLGEALFSRGLFAELRGSHSALGSDANFLQLRLQGERVVDLSRRWHVLLRGQLGASLVPKLTDLPGSQRFFAGGDRSVRGFGFDDLSPLDAQGNKIGGRHMLAATAEIIRDLPRNLSVAVFADAGNAFDKFGDRLEYSAGIGIRWRLPVVTVGIDVAQALSVSGKSPRLHLNFSPKL